MKFIDFCSYAHGIDPFYAGFSQQPMKLQTTAGTPTHHPLKQIHHTRQRNPLMFEGVFCAWCLVETYLSMANICHPESLVLKFSNGSNAHRR